MNPLSKYTSKPYVIGILAIILIPSIGAAFANSSIADFFLSALYVISLLVICGVPFILPDIRKWLKLKNNPEYLYNEIMGRGASEAFQRLEELAKNGNLEAIYFYALTHYVENNVVPFDAEKTFYWASKASQKGYGLAQNLLGGLYLNGVGTEPDYQKAIYWFEESIKNNVHESEIGLFQCYEQGGYGIEQDYRKAFQHLRNHALRTDNVNSKFEVAVRLFDGHGVEENKHEAFKWFLKVANTDIVGTYHDDEIDEEATWVQTIPEGAVINSFYNLAVCYQNGYGTPINEEAAKHWMDKYNTAVRDNDEYAKLDEKGRRKFDIERMKRY